MKIKKIILIFLLFPVFVLSQNKTVTGLVNDENSSPLPGATVQLKGSELKYQQMERPKDGVALGTGEVLKQLGNHVLHGRC